jgi:DNA repair exonuclease SbcCD ATPase subunit
VELKAPYLEQGKKIDEVAKKVIGQLDTSIEGLRKQIRIFELELEKIRQEELRKLEEERRRNEQIRLEQEEAQRKAEALAAKKHQPPPPPLPVVDNSVNDLELALKQKELESQKSKSLRKVWDFDIMDANAIPREFLSIDEKKIRGAIAAGIHEIDGLRIYQRNDLILR